MVEIHSRKKQLYFGMISFTTMILLDCLIIIETPYKFVKSINLFVVIVLAVGLGAFIRELFVQRDMEKMQKQEDKTE